MSINTDLKKTFRKLKACIPIHLQIQLKVKAVEKAKKVDCLSPWVWCLKAPRKERDKQQTHKHLVKTNSNINLHILLQSVFCFSCDPL